MTIAFSFFLIVPNIDGCWLSSMCQQDEVMVDEDTQVLLSEEATTAADMGYDDFDLESYISNKPT